MAEDIFTVYTDMLKEEEEKNSTGNIIKELVDTSFGGSNESHEGRSIVEGSCNL